MKSLLTLSCCILFFQGQSQYYFNDIVSTQVSNDQYKVMRASKIKRIKATSFEADNSVTDGFLLEEDISMDGKRITLTTATSVGKTSVTTRTYELSRLKRTQSVSNRIDTKSDYTYTDKGLLQKLLFTTTDTAMKAVSTELHEWTYNESGQPVSMLKIKDRSDTMRIELVRDEHGLVVEEHWKKKNRNVETYYYYYDAKNQLTDIVRYNARLKKLMPDFLYEYDEKGHVSRMTQVTMSSANYFVWRYTYNEKGLKLKEEGFDKQKRLVGRIEYQYEMN